MTRRQLLAGLSAQAASLGILRQNLEALAGPNIRWAVSMFLWTSTQWPERAPVPFTDMLDVIKDTGFDGLRFVGWPESLDRYGLTELLRDRATLEKMEPNMGLLKSILMLRGKLSGDLLEAVRRIIRKVTDELRRKLESEVRRAVLGRRNLFRHSPQKHAQSFDWRGTLRRNLKHYDPVERRLVLRDHVRVTLMVPHSSARSCRAHSSSSTPLGSAKLRMTITACGRAACSMAA